MKIITMMRALREMREFEEIHESAEMVEAIDRVLELLADLDRKAILRVAAFYQGEGARIARQARMMVNEELFKEAAHEQRRAAACYAIARRQMNLF
jgi:hypothetical protein